jgi:hypothetical protein
LLFFVSTVSHLSHLINEFASAKNLMPKHKPSHFFVTDAEDAAINAGIAADPDTKEWSDTDFASAHAAS